MSIDSNTYTKIKSLCSYGDRLARSKRYSDAKEKYLEALKKVPEPKSDYEASTWIYVAIGDVNFHVGEYTRMKNCFINAVNCPGGLGNPFIHLRLGQSFYELNEKDAALEELTRAYMGGGAEIFEEDDPKYFKFLSTNTVKM